MKLSKIKILFFSTWMSFSDLTRESFRENRQSDKLKYWNVGFQSFVDRKTPVSSTMGTIKWFTLIEVIVSITIFSIIMVSIIAVYILSSDISAKSDINRAMHENIKSVITEIWEDIIKNWTYWVSASSTDMDCNFSLVSNYKDWTKLCSKSWNEYYLAKFISWVYARVESSNCEDLEEQCYLVKKFPSWEVFPLTNSLVSVRDLEFFASSINVSKITIKVIIQPTVKSGVKSNLIADSKLIFETTISERLF